MKAVIGIAVAVVSVAYALSLALANPAMLPKHPGYPMDKAVSPVTGQPLANDPGETNAGGVKAEEAAAAADKHVEQHLGAREDDQRVMERVGAGQLPKVQGPQIMIEPPVKEATRIAK